MIAHTRPSLSLSLSCGHTGLFSSFTFSILEKCSLAQPGAQARSRYVLHAICEMW
jgi:hypothetical protein